MKLSEMQTRTGGMGFTVKSRETGNVLKVVAKSPAGRFLVVKMSGTNIGKEVLVDDTDRYELVDTVKTARIAELKTEIRQLSDKLQDLEYELEELEEETV